MPLSRADKYRGATTADLDPPPALSLPSDSPISHALLTALSHDYTHLTIVNPTTRALLGYISIPHLQNMLSQKTVSEEDPVQNAMVRFHKKGRRYWTCTMDTGLEDLEGFFEGENVGRDPGESAAKSHEKAEKQDFAIVTDVQRKFVLGVATRGDLDEFVRRRPPP